MAEKALEMHVSKAGLAGNLIVRERELPEPGVGELRIKIEAAGVAYADIVMRCGLYEGFKPPVTPGYDFVGRIEAIGPGVSGFEPGQRVAGMTIAGSYATHRNVDANTVVHAPEQADPAELVAVVLNGLTAWQMFHRLAPVEPGEWVLVHGAAGGVGSILLDLARLAGAKVIGSASKFKREVLVSRGAVPLNYQSEDVVTEANRLSDGGVAAAFDHIGGAHFRKVTLPTLRKGGTGVVYGGYNATEGGKMRPLGLADLLLNSRFSYWKLFGNSQSVATYSAPLWRDARPDAYRRDLTSVLELVGSGKLTPLVGATFPLVEAAAAHQALESRAMSGKIVLIP